ncbi:Rossmann fold nucleotide-binding protein Smf possibly involved in DNA uptake [hydrothermal vent metagenome]|uniref:Rossmann fold nucleotide-binding protein Smf possibly involved in DNA uptake n=1 Tax=hydrothermal vent metagenome TaxID=652676 RepID=A0A3B0TQ59_9ZZZZ
MSATTGYRLSDEQRLDWLRLIRCENVGPRNFRDLVTRFGGARAALAALPELSRRGGRKGGLAICRIEDAELEIDLIDQFGARLVALGEADYPPLLSRVDYPPPLLTVKGRGELLIRPAIAIVGARNASAAGRKMAAQLAADLGAAGQVIVSGLALGIDGVAHQAALDTGTIAVVAGGIDIVYPPEHENLCGRIGEAGALVSEIAMGTRPTRSHFPRRNRLVSGIATGTVIIDAAARSGSLITARTALEQNREVFVVPGSPLDPRAAGGNRLIRDGATLVRHADDILEGLNPMVRNLAEIPADQAGGQTPFLMEPDHAAIAASDPGPDTREAVLRLLSVSPVEIDELIRAANAPARDVVGVILELEVAGRVHRQAGQRVVLAP